MHRISVLLLVSWLLAAGQDARSGPLFEWPGRFRLLQSRLRSDDPRVRTRAVHELASYPLGRIEEPLLRLVGDGEPGIRIEAARVLVSKGSRRVLPRLRAWLSDPDGLLRGTALQLMARIGGRAALQEAVKALRDMDPKVRRKAVEAVGELGAKEAISGLLSALADSDWRVRGAAASALGAVTDPRAVIGLIGVLGDESPLVRRAAVAALGQIGDPKAAQAVLRALSDADKKVRLAAVKALGNLDAPQVVHVLVDRALRSTDRSEREAALQALGRLHSPSAASALVSLLPLVRKELRSVVAQLLSDAGSVATRFIVARLELSNTSSEEAEILVNALGEIQDPASAAVLVKEMGRGRVSPSVVLAALARCADWRVVPSLVDIALNPGVDEERVSKVIHALERAADGRSRTEVTRLFRACRLCSEEDRVRLVTILGRIRAVQAFPDVLKLARTGSLRLRMSALESLGWFADRRAATLLLDVLRDGPDALRFAAADAALRCLGPKAVGTLIQMARDPWLGSQARAVVLRVAGALVSRLGISAGAGLSLFASLADGPMPLSLAAVDALGATRRPRAFELLKKLAFEPGRPKPVRCRAVEMLGAFASPELVAKLAYLIRNQRDCAAEAAWVLGKVGKGPAVRKLVRRLLTSADEEHVRRNLTASLARLAVVEDRGFLLSLLTDRDLVVRINALAGLAHMGTKHADLPKLVVRRILDEVRLGGLGDMLVVSVRKMGFSMPEITAGRGKDVSPDLRDDWIWVLVSGRNGQPRRGAEYLLGCPDGVVRSGRLGPDGVIHEERLPAGTYRLVVRK